MGFRISVTIYILIILLLAIFKPSFIYDHNKHEYKRINNNNQITIFQSLSIVLAIVCAILFHEKHIINNNSNIQFIPIPWSGINNNLN
jgi:hypothetical protein